MAIRKLRSTAEVDIDLTDAELTTRATDGDSTAFEELYRRHADAAWRVAYAVVGNRDDAADAVSEAFTKVFQSLPSGRIGATGAPFRPYLLVATRNAAIDHLRRTGRLKATDDVEKDAGPTIDLTTPADRVVAGKDAAYVLAAFQSLPERWRSVLWLTEVEGMQPRDVAPMLGVSPNGVAQLAVRARAGLRERFLQAHLEGGVAPQCQPTIGLLGAYAGGGLSARDTAKVDQHLAGCDDCRARVDELEDVGSSLRRVIIPIPLGLAGLVAAKWKGAFVVAKTVAHPAASTARKALTIEKLQRPLAAASVGIIGVGIIGLGIVGGQEGSVPQAGRPRQQLGAPPRAIVEGFDLPLAVAGESGAVRPEDDVARLGRLQVAAPADGGTPLAPPGPTDNGSNGSGGGNPPTPPPPVPLLQVNAAVKPASTTAAVGLGAGSCTGLAVSSTALGACPAPTGPGSAVVLQTGGTLLGDRNVGL